MQIACFPHIWNLQHRRKQWSEDWQTSAASYDHLSAQRHYWWSTLAVVFLCGTLVCNFITHFAPKRLFFFLFFFFAFPSYISGVHHFWVRFLRMWPFFNPTIKVVTFRLRGWCVLGVFLLPAFTCLGHERQDLLSPCDEMHVCTD